MAHHLRYLNEDVGVIHGDIKSRNIVQLDGGWRLIDLDASCRLGESAGEKLSWPPELANS